ncbi:MAG: alpha-amylase [Clostridiales bacterium]|nr:alpha-amylase [Clostridiales bacterium]
MKLKKIISLLTSISAVAAIGLSSIACGDKKTNTPPEDATPVNTYEYNIPQDYCRTYYEIFVHSFADGNGDGIGDLQGLIDNLDYLNDGDDSTTTDLGINGIWLMPIHQSSSYHKYNVDDYYSIDMQYGTMNDFEALIAACDERGIWVQIDLVLNHSSNQHDWFKAAVEEAQFGLEPDDPAAENMQKYTFIHQETAPYDGMTWRRVPGTTDYWYIGNFSEEMPDINLANQEVRDEIEKIVEFWLKKGVRSFRLDAVPSAFGTPSNAAYSAANAEFWTWFNEMCAEKGEEVYGERYPGISQYCYNVGEVWSSTPTVVQYYNTKMSCFNYGFATQPDSGFCGVINGKSAATLVSNIEDMQSEILEISDAALLSNFLSGHDNDRSAALLRSDVAKIKMGASLYMLMPGNPYIYYGEEIGAKGSGRDENKRMHFNWGDSRNVSDPSGANYSGTQDLGTVISQTTDANSILTYYRRTIKMRNRFPEIGRGVIDALALDGDGVLGDAKEIAPSGSGYPTINENNRYIAAYTLTWNNETIFIVHNVGTERISFDAPGYANYKIVGELHAVGGGSATFANGRMTLDGGTVALLKTEA